MLTGGEVDTVADRDGRTFMLQSAQEKLRHRESARQAAILNALPAHIALLDTRGVILSVNEAWRRFAGANAVQGSGYRAGLDYLAICDSAQGDGSSEAHQTAAGIRSVLSGKTSQFSLEYPCHSPTEQRWFLMTVTPLGANPLDGVVVMHLDITARRSADEAMRESESRFRSLTGMSSDFYWQSDSEHRLVTRGSANLKQSTVSVFERGAQMGERRWEIPYLSPDAAGWQKHREVLDAHLPFRDFELSRLGTDGTERHISISGDPVFDASGVFKGYRGVGTDISERKRIEDTLRRFSSAMDVTADAIYIVDRSSMRFVHVNDTACRLMNKTRAELLTLSPWEFLSISRAELEHTYDALIAGSVEAEPLEVFRPWRDGIPAWVEVRRHALRIKDRWTIVALVRDVSERKRADQKIARLSRVHAVLSGINAAIARHQTRDALFREICRLAVSEGGFSLARVVELDSNGKARIAASTESDPRVFQGIVDDYNGNPEHTQTLLALGLRDGRPLVSNDVASDVRMPNRAALTAGGNHAAAVLPFLLGKRVAGAIVLRAPKAGTFDEVELGLLLELTSNLSFALAKIEEESKVRRLTRVYAVLSGINALIVRVRERDELFRAACRVAVEAGEFRMAWIGVVDREARRIEPVAWHGVGDGFIKAIRLGLAESAPGVAARAVLERKPMISGDMTQDARVLQREQALEHGFHSLAVLPLLVAGEAVGILALYAGEVGFFDEREMKLLTELAGNIAFAMDHIGKRQRLDYLAFYDELTGLANRTLFLERVAQYMRSAASGGHKLAVYYIDLERFRNINENLGRPAGDALLKQVSEWLSHAVGDAGLLARLGADQFAVVLPEVKQDGSVAGLLDKRVREFLEHPFRLNDTEFRIAPKIGVALFPTDGTDADTLLRNAEAALKKAKARGERYLFYKSKMTAAVAGKVSLESQLRQALEKKEFVLHYQPKVNLESGKLTGAEALIRWNDPRTGLVPPGRFIPILEETGLIFEVGRWALRQAIDDYLRWRAAGLPAVRVAVNVSPLQLRNRGFIAEIGQAIDIDPHAAGGLELEITESLIMRDVKLSIASLQAIRAMGLKIAIDDFGTGFSSLSYLAKLPVDTLKIDRSFVIEMTAGPQGLALVATIINLAHSLKLKVVAEGVETEEQSRLLRLLRCDEMQGYLFSKPVPVALLETRFLAPAPAATVA